jgi:hypothetical protein
MSAQPCSGHSGFSLRTRRAQQGALLHNVDSMHRHARHMHSLP